MEKIDRLNKAFSFLRGEQIVSTQQDVADKMGANKTTVSQAFKGTKRYLTDSFIRRFAKSFPELNAKWLLTGEGEMLINSKQSFREQEVIPNKHGNEFLENPTGGYIIKVPLVPFPAYASFIEVYQDEYEVGKSFGTTYFAVDHVGRGRYIGFKVTNDSMNDGTLESTPSGAEVLGRELLKEHWKDGFHHSKYGWLLITNTGIMFKDIISNIQENGTIKLHSRNPSPEYFDFDFNVNDIHSIFKVIKRTF